MRKLKWIFAGLILLIGAHMGLWWIATSRVAQKAHEWQDQANAAGWSVQFDTWHRAGWPYAAGIAVSGLRISSPTTRAFSRFDYQADRVAIAFKPWSPRAPEILVYRSQRLYLPAFDLAVRLHTTSFAASISLDNHATSIVKLRARHPRIDSVLNGRNGTVSAADLTVAGQWSPVDLTDRTAAASLRAESIDLTPLLDPAIAQGLGSRISSMSTDVTITRLDALQSAEPLVAWRRSGGRLQLRNFGFGWGPLGLDGCATLDLDDALQPSGNATLRLLGSDAALDALSNSGTISPSVAVAIKAVLQLVAAATSSSGHTDNSDTGGAGVVIPVMLRDQTITALGIPMLRLPRWSVDKVVP